MILKSARDLFDWRAQIENNQKIGFIPTIEIQKGLKNHILDFKEKHHEHKK